MKYPFISLLNTDTSSVSYKTGYAIGELIPFIIIGSIFIWMMWRRYFKDK